MKRAIETVDLIQYKYGSAIDTNADIIVESPVSLTVNGEIWLSFMCTPVELEALAVGFLFNEGVIETVTEIESIRVCANSENIDIWLNHRVEAPDIWRRTSGCMGGITSIKNHDRNKPLVSKNGARITPQKISMLLEKLIDHQDLYHQSGGVHTSMLSDSDQFQVIAEDIGRHNTLDKLAGKCLLSEIPLPQPILVTTGRISSEMLQKAYRLGTSVVVSRTSPSSLSIHMAEDWGITLIGYARRDRLNIYAHPKRILTKQLCINTQEEFYNK